MSESGALANAAGSQAPAAPGVAPDPLAGDWSEGLPGPLRAHGIPLPTLLGLDRGASPEPPTVPDVMPSAESGIAPPAPEVAPPPAPEVAPPAAPELAPPDSPVSDFLAPPADPAPTPWSEPVPDGEDVDLSWDAAVPEAANEPPPDAASAPPSAAPEEASPAEPPPAESADAVAAPPAPAPPADDPWSVPAETEAADEWQAPAADEAMQEVAPPEPAAVAPPDGADWSSLTSGPDWSAPAASSAPDASSADVWGAPPPAPAEAEWTAAAPPAESEWAPPAAPAATEWSSATVPEWAPASASEAAAPPAAAPAWNAPAAGASALEQLESEPAEPEPGAAQHLFGTVPEGGMLAGDDDPGVFSDGVAPDEGDNSMAIDHDDPDLPARDERAQEPRAQPLAAFRPPALGALEVHGEHRVAVHTRGGRTLRGSVRDVDLSKSQFPLVPQGGGEAETIYHSDVKAIFFMLATGEKPNGGGGARVKVTFADGRVIEGVRDSADAKHGFFLVPSDAARTNTRRIYIAREATSEIKDG